MMDRPEKAVLSVDKVLREYSAASNEFDVKILDEYLIRYPQYAERLRRFASTWLISRRATIEEIAREEVPTEEMLTIQSRLLEQMHEIMASKPLTEDIDEVVRRLDAIEGADAFDRVTRDIFGNVESDEELLFAEYLDPGLRDEPQWVLQRFGRILNCSPSVVPAALAKHRGQELRHYSAKLKPAQGEPRTWTEAVESLSVSEERKWQLLNLELDNE